MERLSFIVLLLAKSVHGGTHASSKVTTSGLSSGADFAGQFGVAFSSTVSGVAMFAGQPYHCGSVKFNRSTVTTKPTCSDPDNKVSDKLRGPRCSDVCIGCSNPTMQYLAYDQCKRPDPSVVKVDSLHELMVNYSDAGKIDAISNLQSARFFLHWGKGDHDYLNGSVSNVRDLMTKFVSDPTQVVYVDQLASGWNIGHAYPIPGNNAPFKCEAKGQGFIGTAAGLDFPVQNCNYDGPGEALKHLYGNTVLKQPPQETAAASTGVAASLTSWYNSGSAMLQQASTIAAFASILKNVKIPEQLRWFDQRSFRDAGNSAGLADWGLVYTPLNCSNSSSVQCDIHLNFHGCGYKPDGIYILVSTMLTFNAWAEANDIIVVYPRTITGSARGDMAETSDQNDGCWNVYGKSGANFATKHGAQMSAVKKIVDYLKQGQEFTYYHEPVGKLGLADLGISGSGGGGTADFAIGKLSMFVPLLTIFYMIACFA